MQNILYLWRPYRETVKSQPHTTVPPPPTRPPKPVRPTASDFYYKDISETTPSSVVYTKTTTKAPEKQSEYAFSDNLGTVPNILKFYHSDASANQNENSDRPTYQQTLYRPSQEETEEPNDIEEETPNYSFENEGSKFFNNSEIFPQFIKNTVVEFSNPAGEDGM